MTMIIGLLHWLPLSVFKYLLRTPLNGNVYLPVNFVRLKYGINVLYFNRFPL